MDKQTFKIPENCKFITQELDQENNRIITTFEPEFKIGDIITGEYEDEIVTLINIIILDNINDNSIRYLCRLSVNGMKPILNATQSSMSKKFVLRNSTYEEKQLLFDALAKEGKQWNTDTLCIEDLKVIPKVGDCCRVDFLNGECEYFVCGYKGDVIKSKGNTLHSLKGINPQMDFHCECNFVELEESKFQKELNYRGFEYNFDDDTIKEIKWEPKEGEEFYFLNPTFIPIKCSHHLNSSTVNLIAIGNCFKTKEECEEAITKIKNILK